MPDSEYYGGCHCRNIIYRFATYYALDELPLRRCICSFCRAHGSLYTSDPGGALQVGVNEPGVVQLYEFATKVVQFVFCQRCGVMPLALTRIDKALYGLVAANTLDVFPTAIARDVNFSNESREAARTRRRCTWIGTVVLDGWPNNPFM